MMKKTKAMKWAVLFATISLALFVALATLPVFQGQPTFGGLLLGFAPFVTLGMAQWFLMIATDKNRR